MDNLSLQKGVYYRWIPKAHDIFHLSTVFFIPLIVIIVCYVLIGCTLRRQMQERKRLMETGEATCNVAKMQLKKNSRRLSKTSKASTTADERSSFYSKTKARKFRTVFSNKSATDNTETTSQVITVDSTIFLVLSARTFTVFCEVQVLRISHYEDCDVSNV